MVKACARYRDIIFRVGRESQGFPKVQFQIFLLFAVFDYLFLELLINLNPSYRGLAKCNRCDVSLIRLLTQGQVWTGDDRKLDSLIDADPVVFDLEA